MPLAAADIENIREMVGGLSYASVESLCSELNTAQEAAMLDDVDEWERIKNKGLRISGGTDGVDLDFGRNRRALRDRVRQRLGLSGLLSSGGLFHIPVVSDYDYSCDEI